MRRQPRPGSEPAISHIRGQCLSKGTIPRPFVTGQVRHPVCHGDKFMIDLAGEVNLILYQ